MENITDHDREGILKALRHRLNPFSYARTCDYDTLVYNEVGKILAEAGVSRQNYEILMTKPHLWPMTRDEWWIGLAKALNYTFLSIKTLPK